MRNIGKKIVLDVGNCDPDHEAIKRMLIANYEVEVLRAHNSDTTLEVLRSSPVSLVLINRKLDWDYSDGVEILKLIKSDPEFASVPVMIVTNYEEFQRQAMELGAVRGFGKLSLDSASTQKCLGEILETCSSA